MDPRNQPRPPGGPGYGGPGSGYGSPGSGYGGPPQAPPPGWYTGSQGGPPGAPGGWQAQPPPPGWATPPSEPSSAAPTTAPAQASAPPQPAAPEPVQRRRDDRVVGGAVLIGLGIFLLLVQLIPDVGRLVPLVVGLFLLAMFVLRREYGLLVAGCIVGGVGLGVALQDVASGVEAGGIVVLCLGLGFLAIYVVSLLLRMPEHHWWPLVPGGILAFIGVVLLSGQVLDDVLRWWPLVLVVIGVLVLAQAFFRPRR